MTRHHHGLPALAVAGSAVLWGLWWLPLRWLAAGALPGDWSSLAIYGAATLVLLPVAWLRRRHLRAGGKPLLLIGLSFGAVLTFWNHGVLVGEVVRVVLLFYLAPVWATGFAWLLLAERPGARRLVSILMGLGGAAVVLGFEGGFPLPRSEGDWFGLVSGLLFAVTLTLTRRAPQVGGLETSFVSLAGGAVIALGFVLFLPGQVLLPAGLAEALPPAALVAALWLLPQTWLVFWGAARLDPGRVSIILLIEVVTAAASAAVLTGEPFGLRETAGCALILGAGLLEGFAALRRPAPAV
ncbi:MAG: DMT family transporter [Rhodospirillales bacterium]|nr:DMT family transporter [Rhodospirillales bacterium]MDH3790704.1 DMT family transporter [Rhodospirillales bacterium]MDH3910193.1 DMT family transporter [Rhodospirillales bacterium]MDH3917516.1 DMT family transporter [Rhodospirillales bacterium]MDH3965783.1 DMT family transporter [Rhodospirillales bacterium]